MNLRSAFIALSFAAAGAASAQIDVNIYTNDSGAGGGAPFSGFAGAFNSPDIMFATNFGYAWHPMGLGSYGADMFGALAVSATGSYSFTLNSDDGSQLFIDGGLVVDDGGTHGPSTVSNSTTLTAGIHPFEVQFFECCGGQAGVDLTLPNGVSYTPVPEPATLALLGLGLPAIIWRRRRRA